MPIVLFGDAKGISMVAVRRVLFTTLVGVLKPESHALILSIHVESHTAPVREYQPGPWYFLNPSAS